jgi:hypothetical protein
MTDVIQANRPLVSAPVHGHGGVALAGKKAGIGTKRQDCAEEAIPSSKITYARRSRWGGFPRKRNGLAFTGKPSGASDAHAYRTGHDNGLMKLAWLHRAWDSRPTMKSYQVSRTTEHPKAIAAFDKLGEEFGYMGPDEFAKFWRKDFEIYKEMGKMFKK